MSKETPSDLSKIAQTLLQDTLANIIHATVLSAHQAHKVLLGSLDPTTRLPHCQVCKMPRLLDPPLAPSVRGTTNDPLPGTTYCENKPWTRKPGHDIYGNPFLKSDVTGRPMTKKERAEQAKKKDNDGDGDGDGPGSPSQETNGPTQKLEKGEKKASKIDEKLRKGEYIPWHTCPNCKRSLLITRFAKHLEQCMGLGRASRRDALAKLNGNGSTAGGSTPTGSRVGTPAPAGDAAGDEDDGDELAGASAAPMERKGSTSGSTATAGGGSIKKKLLKKSLNLKVKKDGGPNGGAGTTAGSGTANAASNGKSGKDNKVKPRGSPAPPPTASGHDGKRDRDELDAAGEDEDEDAMHIKKRQKLQRMNSTASFASHGTATTAPDMEGGESNDGSFVGDGASLGDD